VVLQQGARGRDDQGTGVAAGAVGVPAPLDADADGRREEERRAAQEVLIVDDDSSVRWALQELLQSVGYETLEAGDGIAAMDALLLRRDRLVLLDLLMPRMSGGDVLHLADYDGALTARHAFIIITANRDVLARHVATNSRLAALLIRQAIPVIDKPFDIADVLYAGPRPQAGCMQPFLGWSPEGTTHEPQAWLWWEVSRASVPSPILSTRRGPITGSEESTSPVSKRTVTTLPDTSGSF
jgi:CheY-like chemotaxis protein